MYIFGVLSLLHLCLLCLSAASAKKSEKVSRDPRTGKGRSPFYIFCPVGIFHLEISPGIKVISLLRFLHCCLYASVRILQT